MNNLTADKNPPAEPVHLREGDPLSEAAGCCESSISSSFPKAPHRALSSFLAATSDKRDMGKAGSYPSTVNEVSEDLSRILSAPDSPVRETLRTVTPLI